MYYDFIQTHKRTAIIGFVSFMAIISIWLGADQLSHIGKVPVTISPVPYDASITASGQSVSSGTVWLTAGTYRLKAEKTGFATREKTVVVANTKKHNVVALGLTPVSSDAKKWADSHQKDYKDNEEFGGIEAQANGQYFRTKNPIVNSLPVNDPYFQISYVVNSDDSITLVISTPSPRYRYFAVQKIRELGYDPSSYRVQFKDFRNPLE